MGAEKTILVVEDDPDVREVLAEHLRYAGYTVMTANDGLDGLKKLESGGYDLVITDIVMPYVSGVGLLTAIKAKNPDTPVIVITGYGKESVALAAEGKADGVISKPMDISHLKEELRRLLG